MGRKEAWAVCLLSVQSSQSYLERLSTTRKALWESPVSPHSPSCGQMRALPTKKCFKEGPLPSWVHKTVFPVTKLWVSKLGPGLETFHLYSVPGTQ